MAAVPLVKTRPGPGVSETSIGEARLPKRPSWSATVRVSAAESPKARAVGQPVMRNLPFTSEMTAVSGTNPAADAMSVSVPTPFNPATVSVLEVEPDRKSTRLNSSPYLIPYAVFCLKKKQRHELRVHALTRTVVNTHNLIYTPNT